jgi:hypothetical protein
MAAARGQGDLWTLLPRPDSPLSWTGSLTTGCYCCLIDLEEAAVITRRGCVIWLSVAGPLVAVCAGLSGRCAGADTLVRKTFKYDTPDKCKIDSDIWFCGGTVILTGGLNSHSFSLTIQGQLQPQIKMSGTELVVAKPKAEVDYDQTVIVHRIRAGETPYSINETVEIKNSRFSLKEVTDVCLQAVANFAPATRC